MTIKQGIKAWLENCPLLSNCEINLDFTGTEVRQFGIMGTEEKHVTKNYIDGSQMRQFVFEFTSIRNISGANASQIANQQFFCDFESWVNSQNSVGNLPVAAHDETVMGIYITSHAQVYKTDIDVNKAFYKIQMRLDYLKNI
jgi:hypothetical protein